METLTVQELKKQLLERPADDLTDFCIRLSKLKKENKEYLTYLLFYDGNNPAFVENVKTETDELFEEMSLQQHTYYMKKGLRRILRILNKYCKYMDDKASTAEVQLYFCRKIKETQIPIKKDKRLQYLYDMQLVKIQKIIDKMHEDLQMDFIKDLREIMAMK